MKKYLRASLEVEAAKYEQGKGMEDGYELFSKVVTNGWVVSEGLVRIQNRRGVIFIREGDYIIYEQSGERHVCGEDKFADRFRLTE